MPEQPKPKSGKTTKRKQVRKPEPKSVLTQADLNALRQTIRVDVDGLRAEVDGLRGEIREIRERTGLVAERVLGLDDKIGSLDQSLTALEDRVRLLPTRDEFFTRTDELLTELRAIREEYLTLTHRVRGHEDRITALEEIQPGGQHS